MNAHMKNGTSLRAIHNKIRAESTSDLPEEPRHILFLHLDSK